LSWQSSVESGRIKAVLSFEFLSFELQKEGKRRGEKHELAVYKKFLPNADIKIKLSALKTLITYNFSSL